MSSRRLLEKVLGGNPFADLWRKRIAKSRVIRLPILVLQEALRQQEIQSASNSTLLKLLPTPKEYRIMLRHPFLAGHTPKAIERYVYILRGRNDDERCERYMEDPTSIPLFIFHFLVRQSSGISDAVTLQRMIESSRAYYENERARSVVLENSRQDTRDRPEKMLDTKQTNFSLTMQLLVHHCHRLEPRFVVKLADSAARYIENISISATGGIKVYITQCDLFNECLQILRPQSRFQMAQRATPNAYFWEAQRILLSMSAGLSKPLLVDRAGFRAIREVLSGQPKNHAEVYSAARHAPSWPPYLQPGHGMDERTEPEDNWSRAVSAGMLMQEAGFAKEEADDAVDILQGMKQDGSPTIQQRAMISKRRIIGVWEASIRATRNAEEAWDRFRNPPKHGMKPGLEHYSAMFEKLVLREVEPDGRISPGDKALNFSTQHEANLTEFERARLRPPSISELYQRMRLHGIQPDGPCLRILVANAASLEIAHQYLRDSPDKSQIIRNLTAEEPDAVGLRMVPIALFAAYLQACLRVEGRHAGNQLKRVIRLAESRLGNRQCRWAPFIWGNILKELSQHHHALRISLHQQFALMLRVTDTIERVDGLHLSTFAQFHKGVRKAVRRQLHNLLSEDVDTDSFAKSPFAQALFHQARVASVDSTHPRQSLVHGEPGGEDSSSTTAGAALALVQEIRTRIKYMFWTLARKERHTQAYLDGCRVAPLDAMNTRRDVARSDHAHDYMLTLGYLGDFEEMGRLLEWLVQQWGQFNVVSAMNEMDEAPPHANFFETLCVFRLVAEPILGNDRVSSLLHVVADSGLNWTWPDDEAVKAYAEVHHDESVNTLRRAIDLSRDGNQGSRHPASLSYGSEGEWKQRKRMTMTTTMTMGTGA
ncbi:uncharacterized protein MAM_00009 [Metarhizium album ARSEF 1941]|uniref:Prefoldin subunit 3 n=1 Tax=Metarhizium album (strain ARSEF 1941) TaxID=1081103 RepID=A0A0B2X5G6_METAS|nr:uncharacterized protein MAM_00009 [Metarhizium album ARSEF 1941]KHO01008.1 hypothetical protein MAM_00009 [Metarhizium album ARSEF 1941]